MYFDMQGKPVTQAEWAEFFEDDSARRIGGDDIAGVWVSTVFIGLDHSPGGGAPLIFETMVFDLASMEPWRDLDVRRYATLGEAREGHRQMVEQVRSTLLDHETAVRHLIEEQQEPPV